MTESKERLVELASLAWDRKLTEGTGGNMSMRVGDTIVITPTTRIKRFLTPDDLVVISMSGSVVAGMNDPSSEYRMHLRIYESCEDARAIFHAHPRYATAFAITGDPLPTNALPETALLLAPIAYLPYQTPGTEEFAEAFNESLKRGCRTFVLRNHGVTVVGKNLEEAYAKLETLEFLSQVAFLSGARPGKMEISEEEINTFLSKFHPESPCDKPCP